MKKILIIIGILLYVSCQTNVSICAQKPQEQTLGERFWSWWKAVPAKVPTAGAAIGYGYSKMLDSGFTRSVGSGVLHGLGLSRDDMATFNSYEKAVLSMGTVAFMGFFAWYLNLLNNLGGGLDQIKAEIRRSLLILLANEKLYPTYQSKLHALNNQDDFFGNEFYHYKLFQPTLNEMISLMVDEKKELNNKIVEDNWDRSYYYGKTKKEWEVYLANEKKIDGYISLIQQSIVHYSLEDKLKYLENIKLGDVLGKINEKDTYLSYRSQMAAFESVYGRLKLKLEILRILPTEKRTFVQQRYEATKEAIEARQKKEEKKKNMSLDEQEEYRKGYLERQQKALTKMNSQGRRELPQMTKAEKNIYANKFLEQRISQQGEQELPKIMTEEERKAYQQKGKELREKADQAQKVLEMKRKAVVQ